jgi:flagellar protein FliO/FliZ
MEFFDDLSVPVKFLIAFVVALAVLGVSGYLMRRFSGGNLAALVRRGRQPRLAVIDAASVDGSRRLVLVRRDNVEHLLLIGGPTDVVIEPNIDRTGAAATAPAPVRDTKASPRLEPPPRQTLSLEGSGLPPGEPIYVEPPPPRLAREAMPREAMAREAVTREPMPREAMTREAMLRPPPVPIERPRLESLIEDAGAPPPLPTPPPDAGPAFYPLPVPPSFELAPHAPPVPPPFEPVFQIPPPPEPKRMPAPPPPQRAAQDEESNLAEMAQRLEAALRHPIKPV